MHCVGWRIFLPLLLICVAAAATKDEAARRLRQTERAQAGLMASQADATRAATQAMARQAALAAQRVQAAAGLRTIEQRVQDAAGEVEQATAAERAAEAEITQRSETLSAMLPLALRLSLYPAETMLGAPAPPDGAVEGLRAAQSVSAEVGRDVQALRAEQQKERALAASVTRRRDALVSERARQDQAASFLDREISQVDQTQATALDRAALATQAAAVLAAQADDLRSAIAAMDAAERRAAREAARTAQTALALQRQIAAGGTRNGQTVPSPPAGSGLSAGTTRVAPVVGHITRGWAAPSDDGPTTGLTYSVAPGAYVVSPCAGRVAFAAPFRSYGRLMIIECGAGYDFVLAGMKRLDARVGRTVRAGEPVGRMAQGDLGEGRPAATGSAQNTPLLYVELRKNGQAMDPSPYLNGKP